MFTNNKYPKLTRIKPKWYLRWFKKDKFLLEYEYVNLSGYWSDLIVDSLYMAGEKPLFYERIE